MRRFVRTTHPISGQQAFSLIELVVALAVSSILAVGLGSAMSIASRTLTLDRSEISKQAEAAEVINQIQSELATALEITQRSASVIEFTVPDRTGDFADDTIRYEWTGGPGNPQALTRQFNYGDVVALAEDVREFDLTYVTKIVDGRPLPAPPPPVESEEMLLASYERPTLGPIGLGQLDEYGVASGDYCGQYFNPSLPANALSYKVTRIRFRVKQVQGKGNMIVRLSEATGSNLPGTQLEAWEQKAKDLPGSFQWTEFNFTTASGLVPGSGLCLTLESDKPGNAQFRIEYVKNAPGHPDGMINYNGSWSDFNENADILFEVYGTVTTTQ